MIHILLQFNLCGVVVVSLSLNIYIYISTVGVKADEDLPPPAVKQKGVFGRVCCFALYVCIGFFLFNVVIFGFSNRIALPKQGDKSLELK